MEFDDDILITDSEGDEICLTIEEAKELQQRLNEHFGVEYELMDECVETCEITLPFSVSNCQIIPVTPYVNEPVAGMPYECVKHGIIRHVVNVLPDDILAVIRPNKSE